MSVITTVVDSKLKLNLENGLNEKGEVILKSKTFSNITTTAADEDIYEAGEVLASLQSLPLEEITRVNEVQLVKMD